MNPFSDKIGTWVDSVKTSLPEYASVLGENLTTVMAPNSLQEIESHAVALAAAVAAGNGELAFEISMNGPLFGNDEREKVLQAVIQGSIDSMQRQPCGVIVSSHNKLGDTYTIYDLATAIALKSNRLPDIISALQKMGLTDSQLQDIEDIVSVVATINKVVI